MSSPRPTHPQDVTAVLHVPPRVWNASGQLDDGRSDLNAATDNRDTNEPAGTAASVAKGPVLLPTTAPGAYCFVLDFNRTYAKLGMQMRHANVAVGVTEVQRRRAA